jgi:Uncharacterized conserved protein
MNKYFSSTIKRVNVFIAACFIFLSFQGCVKDKITHTYTILTPVYKTKEQVQANIKSNAPKQIQSPGKIFIYGQYIFLNEVNKGVHIIDNSDPDNPITKAFIDIPGNIDIAVKGNTLYADMYGDLVAVDITDPLNVKLMKDIPYIFPERSYGNGIIADNSRIIVDWIRKDTTVDVQPSGNFIVLNSYTTSGLFFTGPVSNATASGIAGSMARFSIVNDYLYAVDHHNLKSISISNSNDPKLITTTNAGWDIETIYPMKNKLFLGSMGGMFIFDISNPASPVSISQFVHARACDPVVADDNYAYVTLRTGTTCGPANNELQVIDIKNLASPSLLKTYSMTNPHGLSKDGNTIFICDGADGLKVYNASDISNLQLIKQISGIETYDVIAFNGNALIVTKDGLYQYDYSNLNNVHLRSKIIISK